MGGAVFPPCSLIWGQTLVEVMAIMVTSFQRTEPPRTAVVSALTPRKATVNPHLHQRLWTLTGKAGSVSYGVTDLQRSNFQHLLDHRKAREFQKNIYFCLVDYTKVFDYVDHNKLWKILNEIGIPYLPVEKPVCRWRNNRTRHGTTDWFKIGKGVHQGCVLLPCFSSVQFSHSVVSDSMTPWTAARQASQYITNSQSLLKPSHPLSSPSPPTLSLSQHQDLFKWVSSSNQVTKVLEFQLQHQSFQRIFRNDFL